MSMTKEEYESVVPMSPEYWAIARGTKRDPWPEHDPKPGVTTLDPKPADAPSNPLAVVKLTMHAEENGWETRVGYSRATPRAVKLSTYRETEAFTVWFAPDHASAYRPFASYTRFRDAKAVLVYDSRTGRIEPDPQIEAAGKPGPWKWHATVTGHGSWHELSITHLQAFLLTRGLVLPSWFESKAKKPTIKEEE